MDKVVYILGAGFSAPLGLPVMSDFYVKSKDIYFKDIEKYSHFKEVFDNVSSMAVSKNYFKTDLFNIEEILSILDMSSRLEGINLKESFIEYIKDVINFYTPPLAPDPNSLPGNWEDFVFGDHRWNLYGYFICNLLNLYVREVPNHPGSRDILRFDQIEKKYSYSVISLNYDLVLESICDCINKYNYQFTSKFNFKKPQEKVENWEYPVLAKLHGSADSNEIIPPTWSKGVQDNILTAWKRSYELLVDASHIRFVGYSLPAGDAYVKYLLKAAVQKAQHLKTIHCLCFDPDGSVEKRFNDFIDFKFFKFKNCMVEEYLENNLKRIKSRKTRNPGQLIFNRLEETHNEFFG